MKHQPATDRRSADAAAARHAALEEAVREGIRQRRLKRLPLDWVASRR